MSETALKFGPEWLRALSHGGSISSPPSSPGPVKFKLADYRYGREEMLALFSKDFQPPDGLENLGSLCIEQTQEPLAFLPMNIEEQRVWQRCVNSEAVLRSIGRVPPNGVGRGRGGSVDRGRGRGRGNATNYYGRGVSYEEDNDYRAVPREGGPPGMTSRTKGYERSQSMTDARNWPPSGDRSGVVPDERVSANSPLKGRSATGNWRARGDYEEESDRWRGLSHSRSETKWGSSRGVWRDGEWDEGRGHIPAGGRGSRPPWDAEHEREGGYRRHWEEDNLPEWATESPDEKGGSFDATGAFHAPGSSDEEEEDETSEDLVHPISSSRNGPENGIEGDLKRSTYPDMNGDNAETNEFEWGSAEAELKGNVKRSTDGKHSTNVSQPPPSSIPMVNGVICENNSSSVQPQLNHQPPLENESRTSPKPLLRPPSPSQTHQQPSSSPLIHFIKPEDRIAPSEEDKLLHMQSVADDLVAKLVEDVEEEPAHMPDHGRVLQPPAGFIPPSEVTPPQLPEDKWYYTDPQGDIQGPFAAVDMAAWYKAGYFKPNLLLRRQCDDKFAQLGDLTRAFGRVPFLPGPAVPPLKVSELLTAQKAEAERQRYEMMQAQLLQKQLYQQQNTLRQQQVLQSLQSMEEWRTLTPSQQQQLFMQHIMSLPPLAPPTLPPSKSLTSSNVGVNKTPPSLPVVQDVVLPSSSSLPPKQDPIQAFVAQMSAAGSSQAVTDPLTQIPPQPPSSSSPLSNEGPLQKLLSQLQRGPQVSSSGVVSNVPTRQTPPVGLGVDKTPDQQQMDAIQSIMSQLSKIQGSSVGEQDDQRQREEEQKRIEEERRKLEEQRKAEEERIKVEEMRLQEERLKDEKVRKELEMENEKLVEELKRIQADQAKKRKQDETKKKDATSKITSSDASRREEEQKRQQLRQKQKQEEDKKKQEEEKRKKEEARKAKEEERKKEEQQRMKAEEERKRKEKEKERQLQMQEEMRKAALDEERRRMQQLEKEEKKRLKQEEQAKKKANAGQDKSNKQQHQSTSSFTTTNATAATPWSNSVQVQQEKTLTPSLLEIQKAQEIKSKKEKEAEAHRELQRQKEAQRLAAEEKKQKEMASWVSLCGGGSGSNSKKGNQGSNPPQVKSLLEIQKEEQREMKQRQEKEQAERAAAVSHLTLNAAGVWGSAAQSISWANRASSGAITSVSPSSTSNSVLQGNSWNNGTGVPWSAVAQSNESTSTLGSGGFWESPDPPKTTGKASSAARSPQKSGNTPLPSTSNISLPTTQQAVNSNKSKKAKEDGGTLRPSSAAADFRQWCQTTLASMKATASVDVPTFVGFLADVESPYEVHDYIRSYLGDSKEVKEFARQYLERRSRARNALKESRMDDNILAPAPAVNPISVGGNLEFQEVKTRLKKGKKKMQKVDSSILGFSLNSVEKVVDNEE